MMFCSQLPVCRVLVLTVLASVMVPQRSVVFAGPPPAAKSAQPQSGKVGDGGKGRTEKAAIEAALAAPISVDFSAVPLRQVVDALREKVGIEMVLDEIGLQEEGFKPDAPVTLHVSKVPARFVLKTILSRFHQHWKVDSGVMIITTDMNVCIDLKVYDVADLVVCRDSKGRLWDDYDTLVEMITYTVSPNGWDSRGGHGTVVGASLGTAKVLVVAQTDEVHEELGDLLAKVRALAAQHKGDGPPLRDPPADNAKPKK